MHPELSAPDHKGVRHVIPSVAAVHQPYALELLPEVLLNRQKVGENLRGVVNIGEAVPYGNSRLLRQFFNQRLFETAVLNAVEHSPENSSGVLYILFRPQVDIVFV